MDDSGFITSDLVRGLPPSPGAPWTEEPRQWLARLRSRKGVANRPMGGSPAGTRFWDRGATLSAELGRKVTLAKL